MKGDVTKTISSIRNGRPVISITAVAEDLAWYLPTEVSPCIVQPTVGSEEITPSLFASDSPKYKDRNSNFQEEIDR